MKEIFHILCTNLCIHKPIHHTLTPKIPTYELVWQSSSHHIQTFAKMAKLARHLEKPLIIILVGYKLPYLYSVGYLLFIVFLSFQVVLALVSLCVVWINGK